MDSTESVWTRLAILPNGTEELPTIRNNCTATGRNGRTSAFKRAQVAVAAVVIGHSWK
jgi:hypothetical protein